MFITFYFSNVTYSRHNQTIVQVGPMKNKILRYFTKSSSTSATTSAKQCRGSEGGYKQYRRREKVRRNWRRKISAVKSGSCLRVVSSIVVFKGGEGCPGSDRALGDRSTFGGQGMTRVWIALAVLTA